MRPLFRRRTRLQRAIEILKLSAVAAAKVPPPVWLMALVFGLVMGGLLSGCSTAPQLQQVKVAVPVECREKIPDRPVLPVDTTPAAAGLLEQVKALAASIELLEGYAGQLLAGLQGCTKPIAAAGSADGH